MGDCVSEQQILDNFKAFLRAIGKKESSITEYYYVAREFIRAVGAKEKYTEKDVINFLIYKSKKKKQRGYKGEKMRGTYLRFAVYAIKALYRSMNLKWMFKKENMPKKTPPIRRFYTIEDIYKLLDAMKENPRHWLAFKILGLSFSRRLSISMLRREDYDAKEGKITMPSIKGGRTPVIILDKETKKVLDAFLKSRNDVYSALIPSLRARSSEGNWNPGSLNTLLKGYCEIAKVQNKGPHAWRRGIVTYLFHVEKMRELEIWKMGDWISKHMVSEYVQLGDEVSEQMRTKVHPFYKRKKK